MLETAPNIFFTIFSVAATLVGSLGTILVLWLWAAAEFRGKPIKVNGLDRPLDWSVRIRLALFAVPFACFAAFGIWLSSVDLPPAYLSSGIETLPWWTIVIFPFLIWAAITFFLSSSSGWQELSKVYPRPQGDMLASKKLPWAVMGTVTMRNVLTISAYKDGLGVAQNRFIGPFSRPILVPWKCVTFEIIEGAQPSQVRLKFQNVEQAAITLLEECWQPIAQYKPSD